MTLATDVYGLGGHPVHDVGLRSKPRRAETAEAGGGRRRRQSADRVAGEERIVKIHRKSGRQPPPLPPVFSLFLSLSMDKPGNPY
jgi:hypothetical protein